MQLSFILTNVFNDNFLFLGHKQLQNVFVSALGSPVFTNPNSEP